LKIGNGRTKAPEKRGLTMGKIFAVAMVFKRLINNGASTEENLMLHIIRDSETRGDAYLKAFDKEKATNFQDGGCYMKAVLEIQKEDIPDQKVMGFAEWTSGLYKFHGPSKWEDDDGHFFTTAQLWDKYQKEVKP
jgi:hypothetical protein